MSKVLLIVLSLMASLGISEPAHAYMGPGAGLTAIGSVIAFIGIMLLAVIGFLWYPIKRMIKGRNTESKTHDQTESDNS